MNRTQLELQYPLFPSLQPASPLGKFCTCQSPLSCELSNSLKKSLYLCIHILYWFGFSGEHWQIRYALESDISFPILLKTEVPSLTSNRCHPTWFLLTPFPFTWKVPIFFIRSLLSCFQGQVLPFFPMTNLSLVLRSFFSIPFRVQINNHLLSHRCSFFSVFPWVVLMPPQIDTRLHAWMCVCVHSWTWHNLPVG